MVIEHIDQCGEGLHHLGFYVTNFDELDARLKQLGFELLLSGELKTAAGGDAKFSFFDTYERCGIILEISEVKFLGMNLPQTRFFMKIAKLSGDVSIIKS